MSSQTDQVIVYVPFSEPACWASHGANGRIIIVVAESLRDDVEAGLLENVTDYQR